MAPTARRGGGRKRRRRGRRLGRLLEVGRLNGMRAILIGVVNRVRGLPRRRHALARRPDVAPSGRHDRAGAGDPRFLKVQQYGRGSILAGGEARFRNLHGDRRLGVGLGRGQITRRLRRTSLVNQPRDVLFRGQRRAGQMGRGAAGHRAGVLALPPSHGDPLQQRIGVGLQRSVVDALGSRLIGKPLGLVVISPGQQRVGLFHHQPGELPAVRLGVFSRGLGDGEIVVLLDGVLKQLGTVVLGSVGRVIALGLFEHLRRAADVAHGQRAPSGEQKAVGGQPCPRVARGRGGRRRLSLDAREARRRFGNDRRQRRHSGSAGLIGCRRRARGRSLVERIGRGRIVSALAEGRRGEQVARRLRARPTPLEFAASLGRSVGQGIQGVVLRAERLGLGDQLLRHGELILAHGLSRPGEQIVRLAKLVGPRGRAGGSRLTGDDGRQADVRRDPKGSREGRGCRDTPRHGSQDREHSCGRFQLISPLCKSLAGVPLRLAAVRSCHEHESRRAGRRPRAWRRPPESWAAHAGEIRRSGANRDRFF